jgi:hypothetical protein
VIEGKNLVTDIDEAAYFQPMAVPNFSIIGPWTDWPPKEPGTFDPAEVTALLVRGRALAHGRTPRQRPLT